MVALFCEDASSPQTISFYHPETPRPTWVFGAYQDKSVSLGPFTQDLFLPRLFMPSLINNAWRAHLEIKRENVYTVLKSNAWYR